MSFIFEALVLSACITLVIHQVTKLYETKTISEMNNEIEVLVGEYEELAKKIQESKQSHEEKDADVKHITNSIIDTVIINEEVDDILNKAERILQQEEDKIKNNKEMNDETEILNTENETLNTEELSIEIPNDDEEVNQEIEISSANQEEETNNDHGVPIGR